jgi:two-component system KDP operon response regulator KdpE
MGTRILLIDDERAIQRSVGLLLRSHGYEVEVAATGSDGLRAVREAPPDLVVLDLGLPDITGTEICRVIRERSAMPIVVLSARGTERDKVTALDLGADDYVTKPFGSDELLARVRAALRRGATSAAPESGRIQVGDFEIDCDRRRVRRGQEDVRLTPKEFELLELLVASGGRVLTHQRILKAIWGPHAAGHSEHLWVLVGQLRRKIEPDPSHPQYLISEPWVGYRFAVDVKRG